MKIIWRVGDSPTGMYRSFSQRTWPSAADENGNAIAAMYHGESYTAQLAADAGENRIQVAIADWSDKKHGAFTWKTLKQRFSDVKSAKAAVANFWEAHPEYHPPKATV